MNRVPILCRWLLNAVALIVPGRMRDEWRREWYGELWHFIGDRMKQGETQAYRMALSHCAGAVKDAWYLRRNDESSMGAVSRVLRHPAFCIGVLALTALLLAGGTHGFAGLRRMIEPLPYRAPEQLMVLRQVNPFFGARLGLPLGKIPAWRKAESLDGIAAYVGYHALVETDAQRDVVAAAVDPEFFRVLGVNAASGKLFHQVDARACVDCVVVSDAAWRSLFHADPAIVGRSFRIAGRAQKIVGVLPSQFWWFNDSPGVWTLIEHAGFLNSDHALVYSIARLRPGFTADRSLTELRRLYRTMPPVIAARQMEMRPMLALTQDPLYRVLPIACAALFLVSGAAVLLVPRRKTSIRGAAFYVTKVSLMSFIAAVAAIEFAYAPGMRMTGVRGFAPEAISLWLLIFGLVISISLATHDQRRRCPTCLSRLSMPVQMGSRGHVLMEWMSTELVCPNGHGMLWAPEDPLESHPKDRWLQLDDSWQELFEHSNKD